MVRRTIDSVPYTLSYDAENHMTGYSGGTVNATFLYDGDGRRVQSTVNGVTTQFVGSHVEWKSSTSDMVRYYYAGGVRVAMRTGEDGLVWLVGDHLGQHEHRGDRCQRCDRIPGLPGVGRDALWEFADEVSIYRAI